MQVLGSGSRIKHPQFGIGVILKALPGGYRITFIQHGTIDIPDAAQIEVIDLVEPEKDSVSLRDVERMLIHTLEKWSEIQQIAPIGEKWRGGQLLLQPADKSLKPKEVPIETFFHKIVMLRDRLRVMEQRINSSKLDETEKVELQQYITRIYGTLTTFNVLFKQNEHHFKGTGE